MGDGLVEMCMATLPSHLRGTCRHFNPLAVHLSAVPYLPSSCPCSVGRHKRELAEMCVQAVLAVADLERRDVNLDLIKVCCTLCSCAARVKFVLCVVVVLQCNAWQMPGWRVLRRVH